MNDRSVLVYKIKQVIEDLSPYDRKNNSVHKSAVKIYIIFKKSTGRRSSIEIASIDLPYLKHQFSEWELHFMLTTTKAFDPDYMYICNLTYENIYFSTHKSSVGICPLFHDYFLVICLTKWPRTFRFSANRCQNLPKAKRLIFRLKRQLSKKKMKVFRPDQMPIT